jgi:hypothetical protein
MTTSPRNRVDVAGYDCQQARALGRGAPDTKSCIYRTSGTSPANSASISMSIRVCTW